MFTLLIFKYNPLCTKILTHVLAITNYFKRSVSQNTL